MAVASPPLAATSTRPPKGWIATLIVAALMIGIVAGGFIAEAAVDDTPPKSVQLGDVVVPPASGWDFAGRSDDGTIVLLTDGNASLAVETAPGTDVRAALESKREEWVASGMVAAGQPESVEIDGRRGMRFKYSGTFDDVPMPVEGAVTAIAGSNGVVLFDGWAGVGDYQPVQADIDAMISAATIP